MPPDPTGKISTSLFLISVFEQFAAPMRLQGTSRSLPLQSVELSRRRENAKRRQRCIMPPAGKLDMTEIKGVSYFPRYGIIMYAVRIVKF